MLLGWWWCVLACSPPWPFLRRPSGAAAADVTATMRVGEGQHAAQPVTKREVWVLRPDVPARCSDTRGWLRAVGGGEGGEAGAEAPLADPHYAASHDSSLPPGAVPGVRSKPPLP